MHESLFHLPHSSTVPYLPLCEPSWRIWRGHHPVTGFTRVTPDEVETLATGLIPGSWASFFDFDAANDLGPAHSLKKTSCEGDSGCQLEDWMMHRKYVFAMKVFTPAIRWSKVQTKGTKKDKKENLGTSPGFVTEDARLHSQNNRMTPSAKEDFVTDSIASSPGCKPSANRR